MKEQKFIIKNMTCSSCVKLVENELLALGINNAFVKLGEIKIANEKIIDENILRTALQKHGFGIVNSYEEELVEKIRLAILEFVNSDSGITMEFKFTDYLEKKLGKHYKSLSKIFSKHKKESVETFFIHLKIEKAKEMIQYGELSFSEIAYRLGYSNTQHLSGQFKKIVGSTMSEFKENPMKKRISMNKL